MATQIIPMVDAGELGNFYFTVDLDGIDYQLRFTYNQRDQHWYFDLSDVEGNIIRAGIKIVINFPLLRLLASFVRPPGELIAIDTRQTLTQAARDPELTELGTDVLFAYEEQASLP